MASWARQRQQITEAADGGARACTGADGAVVLNLRRGPGAYALLSRADGQLTRAGQHYYSHLGLRPPSKDFNYNQPLIREGPNDYILLRNGQKKLVRSLQGGEHRLTIIPGALKQLESLNNTRQGNLERKHSFSAHGVEHQGKERSFLERGGPQKGEKGSHPERRGFPKKASGGEGSHRVWLA